MIDNPLNPTLPQESSVNTRPNLVWLASFPRSGNTLIRTILWNCFGLRSGSIYPNDLGNNTQLEKFVGHIEHEHGKIVCPENQAVLPIKTHELDRDSSPAIYIVRDGRDAITSLWDFYGQQISLQKLIEGNHQFGTWQNHLASWRYPDRPNTLFLKYETLTSNFEETLNSISTFLKHDIASHQLPNREVIAGVDGRWVRQNASPNNRALQGDLLELFNAVNAKALAQTGYFQN